mgnify:CR=1 FL=1
MIRIFMFDGKTNVCRPVDVCACTLKIIAMTEILFIFSGFLVSVLLGVVLITNILVISYKKKLFDLPDARKVHSVPVPRLGGFSFLPVVLVTVCMVTGFHYYAGFGTAGLFPSSSAYELLLLAVGSTSLYLTGIADDLVGIGYRSKFVVQLATALLFVLSGNWIDNFDGLLGICEIPAWLGMPFTVVLVVYITNAINLIDGIDGLASGLCAIAFAAMGTLLAVRGEYVYALLSFSFLGVLVPFWIYNVFGNVQHHRKLFMGDAGSLTLGYVLSYLAIHLSKGSDSTTLGTCSDMAFAFSTLLVPLFDVVRVVLCRLREGKNPFMPDQNHIHHKLLRAGLTPRKAMATILSISVSFIILNVVMDESIGFTWMFVCDILLWTILQLQINRYIKARQSKNADF